MAEQVSSLKTGIKYKDTPIGKIPVDWEVLRLRNIATEFYNGGTPDTKNRDYWNGTIPWITGADFENQRVKTIRRHITTEGVKSSATNVIPKGNLLIVTRTGVGKVAIAPFDIAISQDITGVILDSQKASAEFVYWYLDFISSKLKSTIQGTSINGLLRNDLKEIGLPLPFIEEQKKIAESLKTVDEAIEKTAQIIEKAKEVKKGLMQRLLTRGIVHKKFRKTEIGEIPDKWELRTFKELLDEGILSGIQDGNHGNDHPKSSDYVPSGVPFIMANNLVGGTVDIRNCKFIRKNQADKLRVGFAISGDVLLSHKGTIGRVAIVPEIKDYIMLTPQVTYYRIGQVNKLSNAFLGYFMESRGFQDYVSKLSRQSTRNYIGISQQKNLFMVLPSLNEQKQIAEILTSIDQEIEEETTRKEQLEFLKKGLMQVLLTGKIRVNI